MRIFAIIFAAVLAVSSSTFALSVKPAVQKVSEYKIQRVEGSKVMSNLPNKSASTKLPVIVTFNSMKEAQGSGISSTTRAYKHIPSVAATMTMAEVHKLAKRADVKQIEYDEPVKAYSDGANYWYGTEKARTDFGVEGDGDGNVSSYTKEDNTIAVIDTGIDASHVDLQGKVIGWYDVINNRTTPYDDNGHGTHVAGIAAGAGVGNEKYKGVAPGAALVGVKVLSGSGSGSTSGVIAGIDWAIQNKDKYGIKVINMSLGSSGSSDGTDASSLAVNRAVDAGIVCAIAAGNSGPNTKTVGSPGAATKALTVGAMADPTEGGFNLAPFSSRGETADGRVKPDIAAPGVRIMAPKANTGNGYVEYSGTSMATPFVAGAAALMLDANPLLTPAQVAQKMESTAGEWGTAGKDVDYGAGNLRGYDAIKSAGGFSGIGPTLPQHIYKEGSINNFRGKVDYPLSLKTGDKISLTMIIPNWRYIPDLDVYLLDPQGRTVAYSIGTNRQETINHTATYTGEYTVSVRSYMGTGDFFFDISKL